MRNVSLILVGLGLAVLVACKKETPEIPYVPADPQLLLTNNGDAWSPQLEIEAGDSVEVKGLVVAEAGIRMLIGTRITGADIQELIRFEPDTLVDTLLVDPIIHIYDVTQAGSLIHYRFDLVDSLGRVDSLSFTVAIVGAPMAHFPEVRIGAYGGFDTGNFLNILGDTTYFANNLRGSDPNRLATDLIFHYDATSKWLAQSPDHSGAPALWSQQLPSIVWPFEGVNATRMALVTDVDFEGIDNGVDLNGILPAGASSQLTGLVPDQVVAFQLAGRRGSKLGLMKVRQVAGTTNANRSITVSIKVQL